MRLKLEWVKKPQSLTLAGAGNVWPIFVVWTMLLSLCPDTIPEWPCFSLAHHSQGACLCSTEHYGFPVGARPALSQPATTRGYCSVGR